MRSWSHARKAKREEAISYLRRAVAASKEARLAYHLALALPIGKRRLSKGRGDDELADAMLALWPNSLQVRYLAALLYEDDKVALDMLEEVSRCDSDSIRLSALRDLTSLYEQLGRVPDAIRCAREALALAAAFPVVRFPADLPYGLARQLVRGNGDPQEIERLYRYAMKLDPKEPQYPCDLGSFLNRDGDRAEDARALYEAALNIDPTLVPALINLANLASKDGRVDEALERLRFAWDCDMLLGPAHRHRARIATDLVELLLGRGDLYEAESILAQGVAFKDSVRLRWQEARIHQARGHLNEAVASFERAIELDATFPEAHCDLALLHFRSLEYDKARARAEAAIELKPSPSTLANAYNVLAMVAYMKDEDQQSLELLEKAWATGTKKLSTLGNSSPVHISLEDFRAAAGYCEDVLDMDAESRGAHSLLAFCHEQEGSWADAAKHYRVAHELRFKRPALPRFPATERIRSVVLRWAEELDEADELERAIEVLDEFHEAFEIDEFRRPAAELREDL